MELALNKKAARGRGRIDKLFRGQFPEIFVTEQY
jgi:hypothetical protein